MLGNIILNALRTGRTFKDTANTGLLFFNNRLLALMEASKPFEMVGAFASLHVTRWFRKRVMFLDQLQAACLRRPVHRCGTRLWFLWVSHLRPSANVHRKLVHTERRQPLNSLLGVPIIQKFSGSKERLETAPQYFDFHGQLEHPMTAHPKVAPCTGYARSELIPRCLACQMDAPSFDSARMCG